MARWRAKINGHGSYLLIYRLVNGKKLSLTLLETIHVQGQNQLSYSIKKRVCNRKKSFSIKTYVETRGHFDLLSLIYHWRPLTCGFGLLLMQLFNPKCDNRNKSLLLSRLLKCLRSLYGKQCGPISDCSVLGPRCLLLYLIRQ